MVFGCSFLLTAAGQSRICTGFPLGVSPGKRHQQAVHKIRYRVFGVNLNVVVLKKIFPRPKTYDAGVGFPAETKSYTYRK